eukprot:TRINITY_DN5845_c0_g2_i1.p1 TRINITY_DN5845_c0_g2~~TRINITY_DN5845_c0_g2_i1.p1  ORF type:complete len:249 (+),score=57.58 TRINITY_DN5845_c0_g2_i1:63-749(+)
MKDLIVPDPNHPTPLGEGATATVYKGFSKNNVPAAFKMLTLSRRASDRLAPERKREIAMQIFREFRAEAWIMKQLQTSPYIVHFIGIVRNPPLSSLSSPSIWGELGLALATEYMPAGSLYDLLRNVGLSKNNKQILTWRLRIRMAIEVAKGIWSMHKQSPPIIHRDLKTLNVLLTRLPNENDAKSDNIHEGGILAKIADFGTCVASASFVGRVVDNPLWLAPEVMSGF